ncbi:MAG: glycosyltransferase family 2 protein [Bacteroidetes bacterium]|nr:glycosyltransferase family 2 protein [Bacteroidota bacterium]
MEAPAVTLVIVNWNGKHHLERFLPSVAATDYPSLEILVLDNASTDDSCDFLETHYPDIRLVRNSHNDGFARGNNIALQHVHTPLALLLNSDVEVTPGWLHPLVARLQTDARIAAVQPKVRALYQPHLLEYAGGAGGWIDTLGFPFCRGRVFEELEPDNGQYDDAQPVFWTTGACMLLRMEAVQDLGYLFDEAYFAHMEEIDFCWRAQNRDWQLWVEPASVVYHLGGGTLPKQHPRKTYYNVRNSLMTLVKNLPAGAALRTVLIRLPLDGAAAMMELATKGNWRFVWAVLRAHFAFYRRIPYCLRQRRGQKRKPLRALQGVYPHWLVWQYFARKKRTFSTLLAY